MTADSPSGAQAPLEPARRRWSLRWYLLGLVGAAAVPFALLLAYLSFERVTDVVETAQSSARDVAELMAANIQTQARHMTAVADVVATRASAFGLDDCTALRLPELRDIVPNLASAFVTDASGRLRCSALSPAPAAGLVATDRAYFPAALASDTPVFSEALLGRVSGDWVVIAARRVRPPDGRVLGVAGASIEVSALRLLPGGDSSSHELVTVVDQTGRVLARSSNEAAWIGRAAGASPVVAAALAGPGGTLRGSDLDGVERLWGYARVPPLGWVVLSGVDAAAALAAQRRMLVGSVLAAALIVGGVLSLALLIGARISRPILALSRGTRAVEQGEYPTMAPVDGPAELTEVGRGFNAMVTARRSAEEALRASEEKFQRAFGASPMPLVISTFPDGRIVDVNAAFEATFGWRREAVVGRDEAGLRLWREPDDRAGVIAELASGHPVLNRESEFLTIDGDAVATMFSADLMELDGRPCIVSLLVDISARRSLEAQLRQAQKMEAIGQLTGGIAHDFNNLLTVVLGNAELMAAELPPNATLREEAEAIKTAALRGATMVRKLLAVARRERLVLAPLNLVEACQDSASMFRHLIPATIGVQVTATEPVVLVKADRGSVDQILLNLVTNARDAMPDGGELRVEVSRSVVDGEADSPGAARAGEYGVLAVADTGVGMDEAVKSRLFEPFFTTKTREQGTGLGLSSVDGLVSQHQGFVKVESAPMRGTTVKVYLPIASAGAEPLEEPAPPPVHGGETILLVEDDPLILAIGRRVLERAGYLVLVATDGDKALDLLRAPGPPVHLVVSDVVMPNRTGPALLRAARTLERQPPFLFMSGYSDLGADDRAAIRDAGFIAKPWSVAGLLVKVREALDSRL